jgi:hypothetical protein
LVADGVCCCAAIDVCLVHVVFVQNEYVGVLQGCWFSVCAIITTLAVLAHQEATPDVYVITVLTQFALRAACVRYAQGRVFECDQETVACNSIVVPPRLCMHMCMHAQLHYMAGQYVEPATSWRWPAHCNTTYVRMWHDQPLITGCADVLEGALSQSASSLTSLQYQCCLHPVWHASHSMQHPCPIQPCHNTSKQFHMQHHITDSVQ